MVTKGRLLPIRDINPRIRVPVVNYALLASCGLIFLFQFSQSSIEPLIREYGFVPADFHRALADGRSDVLLAAASRIATSMFLHVGWSHIFFNLVYLRVFGDNVEDRFGHLPFLLFYVASGGVGAFAHYLSNPTDSLPTVGASGAIAGVLGAYVVLFPSAKVLTLFPIFIFFTFIEVPAFVFLGIWTAQQLLNGYFVLEGAPQTGVAWFAHIGGFALGILCGLVYKVAKRARRAEPEPS